MSNTATILVQSHVALAKPKARKGALHHHTDHPRLFLTTLNDGRREWRIATGRQGFVTIGTASSMTLEQAKVAASQFEEKHEVVKSAAKVMVPVADVTTSKKPRNTLGGKHSGELVLFLGRVVVREGEQCRYVDGYTDERVAAELKALYPEVDYETGHVYYRRNEIFGQLIKDEPASLIDAKAFAELQKDNTELRYQIVATQKQVHELAKLVTKVIGELYEPALLWELHDAMRVRPFDTMEVKPCPNAST